MNYKMLEYDRINFSEGIDVSKSNKSKECMFYHCWYFLDKNFSYGTFFFSIIILITQTYKTKNITITRYYLHSQYLGIKKKRKGKKKNNNKLK